MPDNAPATRPSPSDVVSRVYNPESVLIQAEQSSRHTEMEPITENASTVDTWKVAYRKSNPQH